MEHKQLHDGRTCGFVETHSFLQVFEEKKKGGPVLKVLKKVHYCKKCGIFKVGDEFKGLKKGDR